MVAPAESGGTPLPLCFTPLYFSSARSVSTKGFALSLGSDQDGRMSQAMVAIVSFLVLATAVLVLIELGRRAGMRRRLKDEEAARAGLGALEGAIFGLMGLLVAFTFSGAASRFDARRSLIVQEANDIGTAWLRLDLLRPAAQPPLRKQFRDYVEFRLAMYSPTNTPEMRTLNHIQLGLLQSNIWALAVPAAKEASDFSAPTLLLPALNAMFDITSTRSAAARFHPPHIIYLMLVMLLLTSSLIAGHGLAGSKSRSWIHMISFAVIMSATVWLIIDLEYPRIGLLRIEPEDRVLADLREMMR